MKNWLSIYRYAYEYIFIIDVAIATMGYIITLRLFDAHNRSVEPTLAGWLVCIICYWPFMDLVGHHYLRYYDAPTWGSQFSSFPTLQVCWSILILFFLMIYVWATVQFGIRASNLTHRGILTNGPYRWSKHPAYLSKCISWWLISLPFLAGPPTTEAIRLTILLIGLNLIYFARAKTEERHLSNDPIYEKYKTFIQLHGVIAVVKRTLRGQYANVIALYFRNRARSPSRRKDNNHKIF